MMFAKRHYNAIAGILARHSPETPMKYLVSDFIDLFELDSDKFDADRFKAVVFHLKGKSNVS